MRKSLLSLFVYVFASIQLSAQSPIDVLFIGNSLTYVNDLPTMLEDFSSSMGKTVETEMSAPGGCTFNQHCSNNTVNVIKNKKWHFVVLHEQSQYPAFPDAQIATEVYPYAKRLDSLINVNDSCTETIFFMTWGHKYGDQQNGVSFPPIATYDGMMSRLRKAYMKMALDNHSTCAPVGEAWRYARTSDSTKAIWSQDNNHPDVGGTYLSACVFYAIMFQESPLGSSYLPTGISQSDADFYQQIAHDVVIDSLYTWLNTGDIPQADFTTSLLNATVDVQSVFTNFTSETWDFGDNSPFVNSANPTYTYADTGVYIITHTVEQKCASHSFIDTIRISHTSLDESQVLSQKIKLYPNPMKSSINIDLGGIQAKNLRIYTADGRSYKNLSIEGQQIFSINTDDFPQGMYIFVVEGNGFNYRKKIIK